MVIWGMCIAVWFSVNEYWLLLSYDVVYKQAVSTEDVFLGMGNKSPTTASCEDIIVSTASLFSIICLHLFA